MLTRDGRAVLREHGGFTVLGPTGDVVATVRLTDSPLVSISAPLLDADDTAYVIATSPQTSTLFQVHLDGRVRRTELPQVLPSPSGEIAQQADGSIVVALDSGGALAKSHVLRVTDDGRVVSDVELPPQVGAPSVMRDGHVLAHAWVDGLHGGNPSIFRVDTTTNTSRLLAEGLIAAGATSEDQSGRYVIASPYGPQVRDATGAIVWFAPAAAPPGRELHLWSPAVVAGDGTVVVADLDSNVYGFLDGTKRWTIGLGVTEPKHQSAHIAIGPDGTVIVCASRGRVFALR